MGAGIQQSDALILSVTDLQEADRVVEFLTRDQGKKRGAARGARRRYSRFAGELQPLAKVRVGWFEKEGRELVRVTSVELLRPERALQADLEGLLLAACLGELVATFAPEGEPAEKLFRLLDTTLEALAAGVDRRVATCYVESWVLRLTGIFPAPVACPLCGAPLAGGAALDAAGESLVCRSCASGSGGALPVSAAALELLTRLGRESLPRLAERPPLEPVLDEVGDLVGRVRRRFLGHELRSYEVRRRTLGEGARA